LGSLIVSIYIFEVTYFFLFCCYILFETLLAFFFLFVNASGWIRGRDSLRVLHYEGGGSRTPCTDIVCPMYMRVWDMVKIASDPTETRPLILCEYDFVFLHQQHSMTSIVPCCFQL